MSDKRTLYTLSGRVGIVTTLPYAFQQVFTMFAANILPITLIGAAASPSLSQEEILRLVQSAMIAAGIATIIQATPVWRLGSGLPIFMGISFTFVVPLSAIAARYGYGAVTGAVLVGGVFEGILGLTVRFWRRLMPPIVSAVVVTGIGISLLSAAARSFGGGYAEDFGSVPNLVIGTVVLVVCILCTALSKGLLRRMAVLVGLAAGCAAALFFGKLDLSGIAEGGWFSLPRFLPYAPQFHPEAIVSVCLIYMVSATETLGDASAIVGGVLHRELTEEETAGALTVDGLGSVMSGLLGGTPVTSYSENIGLTIMNRVINRRVARVGGVILILCGLFPPIGRFFGAIPDAAFGGMLLMVMGEILVSGIEMIAAAGFTTRNRLIAAVSLSAAIGLTASTEAGLWAAFPEIVRTVFSENIVAVIFVIAVTLNLVLPKDMGDPSGPAAGGERKTDVCE